MAKIKKLKRLGMPPGTEDIRNNLDEPDFTSTNMDKRKIDGRSLRKTGFTEQFNVKVPEGFKEDLANIAIELDITYGKILVNAIKIYKEQLKLR